MNEFGGSRILARGMMDSGAPAAGCGTMPYKQPGLRYAK
jgi:hypothetical protein